MKATILQSNFAKALNQVSKVVGSRTTLPVLSNILISIKKGKIRFSATDLEVGITTQTIGKIESEGEITLPARLLADFVLNNKDESIELSLDGLAATLKSDRYEAKIQGIAAEEFPSVPDQPTEFFVTIEKKLFAEGLKKVAMAPATDETRPVLAGIYFQFDDKILTLAATDSFRLAEKKITLEKPVAETKIIVPARTMNEILRLLSANDAATDISINVTENQVAFKIADTFVVSRLIEGVFPNYSQIIPTGFKITAKSKLSDLVAAVKMSSFFAKDASNNNLKVAVEKDLVTISSVASQAGSSKSKVKAETTGDKIEIAFNARYIMDVLAVISDDKVDIKLNDMTTAGVISSEKDKDYIYIIMPLKVE
jgi:DNA polymerase-3 subunit beta